MEFRPTKIEELFGQDHLKPILTKWLNDTSTIPQSILIHGPYGMGKTSIARILAKAIVSNDSDILEMNAAAARGIDDIRELAESTVFSGLSGNKVYILDELHQMTQQAQSALLKEIEEPRPGIYFILCTTDFPKLLDTIRSRCTKLEVRILEESDSMRLMDFLAPNLDNDLKMSIFYSSGGHARDIVKSVAVGLSNPQIVQKATTNINNAFTMVGQWFNGENINWFTLLDLDEQTYRNICDNVCSNPTMLGSYFNFNTYDRLMHMRAQSLLYLVTQKQRFIHLMSVRY